MAGKTAQGNRAYEEMESKRVSLIELFYDLVFVYMISRATELLHHLHNGVISPTALIIFIFVVIVFINSWMVQTVFHQPLRRIVMDEHPFSLRRYGNHPVYVQHFFRHNRL